MGGGRTVYGEELQDADDWKKVRQSGTSGRRTGRKTGEKQIMGGGQYGG